MADEIDVAHRLQAHHCDERAVPFIAPERDAGGDLAGELVRRHVGLVPAVGRDHAAIGLRGGIHDRQDGRTLVLATEADVAHDATLFRWMAPTSHLSPASRSARWCQTASTSTTRGSYGRSSTTSDGCASAKRSGRVATMSVA